MKKSLMLVFAVVANFSLVLGQVQIFAGGGVQISDLLARHLPTAKNVRCW